MDEFNKESVVVPLRPDQIEINKNIDSRIIEAINEILKEKYTGESLNIKKKDIHKKMNDLFGVIDFKSLYERKQFDFENFYKDYGWDVGYDSPGWNETPYDEFYIFRPIKKK